MMDCLICGKKIEGHYFYITNHGDPSEEPSRYNQLRSGFWFICEKCIPSFANNWSTPPHSENVLVLLDNDDFDVAHYKPEGRCQADPGEVDCEFVFGQYYFKRGWYCRDNSPLSRKVIKWFPLPVVH